MPLSQLRAENCTGGSCELLDAREKGGPPLCVTSGHPYHRHERPVLVTCTIPQRGVAPLTVEPKGKTLTEQKAGHDGKHGRQTGPVR